MLIASHIKPWAKFPNERMNLRNGLCLSAIHDRAFDYGLMTFGPEFELIIGTELKRKGSEESVISNFVRFEGRPMQMPEKVSEPDPRFLAYHRQEIFMG